MAWAFAKSCARNVCMSLIAAQHRGRHVQIKVFSDKNRIFSVRRYTSASTARQRAMASEVDIVTSDLDHRRYKSVTVRHHVLVSIMQRTPDGLEPA